MECFMKISARNADVNIVVIKVMQYIDYRMYLNVIRFFFPFSEWGFLNTVGEPPGLK